jgi:multidrug resistance efflux pump
MDVETKPRRRWKQRKADYLAAIAAMQAERDAAQMDAFELRQEVTDLTEDARDAHDDLLTARVVIAISCVVALAAGYLAGSLL